MTSLSGHTVVGILWSLSEAADAKLTWICDPSPLLQERIKSASLCRFEAQESAVTSRFEVCRGRGLPEVS